MTQEQGNPVDLSIPAIKVARRLQALPDYKAYKLELVKTGKVWVLILEDGRGKKAEICQ